MMTLRQNRISIFIICVILISLGLVMVYNSTALMAYEYYGSSAYFFQRHLVFILVGLVISFFIMLLDIETLKRFSKPCVICSICLLILVLIPSLGRRVSGAQRWFHLVFFNFQPSEFVKVAIILYLADFMSRKREKIKSLTYGFLPPMLVVLLCFGLILLQPDLGTAVLIFAVAIFMLFAGGARIKYIFSSVLLAVPAFTYLIINKPYRVRRIISFINPWKHKADAGYQLVQSLIALGSGGLFGVGLGGGQQKLYYLPAAHTDFIFSIIGEELGFLGAGAVILLFAMFIFFAALIAFQVRSSFSKLLILGVVSLISLQAIVHIGTSTGFLPTKGLPLPFLSYGGSSLVFNMAAVALLLNVSREKERI